MTEPGGHARGARSCQAPPTAGRAGRGRDPVRPGHLGRSAEIMEAVIASTGLAFSVTVCAEDVRRGKPDPEPYLRAAALLGEAPARCVALEDSPRGIAAAQAAGCPVIAVPSVPLPAGLTVAIAGSLREIDLAALRGAARVSGRIRAARRRFVSCRGPCDGKILIRSQSRNDIVPGLAPVAGRGHPPGSQRGSLSGQRGGTDCCPNMRQESPPLWRHRSRHPSRQRLRRCWRV